MKLTMKSFGVSPGKIVCFVSLAFPWAFPSHAQQAYTLQGDIQGTHDPSIAKDGKFWYVFSTGKAPDGGQLPIRCSSDLMRWRSCGHVFDSIPFWIQKESPGTKDLWAPDISKVDGEYRLYYCYSLFGKNASGIALAVNKTLDSTSPEYRWVDKGLVLKSVATDNYNAIDPNYVKDQQGRSWLAFGSFWTGIKLRRLTSGGKPSSEDTRLYSIASRSSDPSTNPKWPAIEAPFLITHGGFYYLFVSFDICCRGEKSTYRTMVGRAKSVTGPYLDQDGKPMEQGGGTELLRGNARWAGPGGESLLLSKPNDLMVFHAYDALTGKPALQISTITWHDDWPRVALNEGTP